MHSMLTVFIHFLLTTDSQQNPLEIRWYVRGFLVEALYNQKNIGINFMCCSKFVQMFTICCGAIDQQIFVIVSISVVGWELWIALVNLNWSKGCFHLNQIFKHFGKFKKMANFFCQISQNAQTFFWGIKRIYVIDYQEVPNQSKKESYLKWYAHLIMAKYQLD